MKIKNIAKYFDKLLEKHLWEKFIVRERYNFSQKWIPYANEFCQKSLEMFLIFQVLDQSFQKVHLCDCF